MGWASRCLRQHAQLLFSSRLVSQSSCLKLVAWCILLCIGDVRFKPDTSLHWHIFRWFASLEHKWKHWMPCLLFVSITFTWALQCSSGYYWLYDLATSVSFFVLQMLLINLSNWMFLCWWLVLVVDIRLKQPFFHKWRIIIIWRLRSHLPLIFLSCCHVSRMLVHHQHGRRSYRSCGAMIDAMVSHGGTIMSGDFYSEIRLYLSTRNQ